MLNDKKAEVNPNDISKNNMATYGTSDIVLFYANLDKLKPAEQAILELLKNRLSKMRMLDIGVGAGRTTKFFAPLTNDYIGVDYSPQMVERCIQKFPEYNFKVADARKLPFSDSYFDFTLFSNNGLDYMEYNDRLQVLKEMHRVTKEAFVCFSTHNLNNIYSNFRLNFPVGYSNLKCFGIKFKDEAYRICKLFLENRSSVMHLKKKPYLLFNDGVHEFRLVTYYVKPEEQIRQLKLLNFNRFQAFGEDGRNIPTSRLPSAKDFYIYFLSMG
jgi:SAM-dependent methyltransferase